MASRTMPSVELRRATAICAAALGQVIWSADAFAYRPFDGTDASVIDPGELEVRLGVTFGFPLRHPAEHRTRE